MVPSACRPQVWALPAVMAVNRSSGGAAWPLSLLPQHWAVPSSRIAHECQAPAATAVNRPRGASAWPLGAFVRLVLLPQQVMVPSPRSPQVWTAPALAVERDGAAVVLRVGGNDLPISRASVEWGPKLTLSVPADVELTVRTGSGAVVVQGLRSDRLEVFTAKGDVFVGDCAGPLQVAGGSGSVRVARCDGDMRLSSTSGAIEVADARGAVIAHTESGSQRFHRIEGDLTVLRGTALEVSEHRGRLIVEERD